MEHIRIQWRLFAILAPLFIAFTIIGTVSHECGHALAARYYGYNPHIAYNYTTYPMPHQERMDALRHRYGQEIEERQVFPDSAFFWKEYRKTTAQDTVVTWGGPVQSMLTGTVGLAILLSQWKRFKRAERLRTGQWLILFLALFWLRPLSNFLISLPGWISNGRFSTRSDEAFVALNYDLPVYSISAITAGMGLIAFGIVCLAIPGRQRATFILSGLVGGLCGFMFWLKWIGPLVMP